MKLLSQYLYLEHLDKMLLKSLRYKHHQLNYEKNLCRDVIPKGFRIRKDPSFQPVSDDFRIKWSKVIYNAEKNLVELLL